MKKVLVLTLVFVLGFIADATAQTYKYYSTDFAYKTKKSNGAFFYRGGYLFFHFKAPAYF